MQIRNDARAKTAKLRSLKRPKASAGKIFEILKPPVAWRSGGVCGSVKQYKPIAIEDAAARRIGIAVASTCAPLTFRCPTISPATIQPSVPSTRIDPKSCFGSFIWRNERELVSAIVGRSEE